MKVLVTIKGDGRSWISNSAPQEIERLPRVGEYVEFGDRQSGWLQVLAVVHNAYAERKVDAVVYGKWRARDSALDELS